jgi:hypothetical protein
VASGVATSSINVSGLMASVRNPLLEMMGEPESEVSPAGERI